MDRFFVCLSMGYPEAEEEVEILTHLGDGIPYDRVQAVVTPEILLEIRRRAAEVQVSEYVSRYIVELVQQTRRCPWLKQGGSPRASRSLYQGGKAYAAMQGREFVTPEDIQAIWLPVMNHRVVPTSEARFQKKTAEAILQELMEQTEVPPYKKELFHGNKAE
jgi:MoxR-like ATPase